MGTSLYIDRKDVEVRVDGNALAFYEEGHRTGTVPLAPIDRVFVRGACTISSKVFAKLGENGIGMIFLSGRKATPTMFLPRSHNDAARRVAQYRLSTDETFCLDTAKAIVTEKLSAQKDYLLERFSNGKDSHHPALRHALDKICGCLKSVPTAKSIESLRGIEGIAAREYFAVFAAILPASLHFSGRNRRPPRDPLNAVLSLGYTLLHFEAVTALYGAGLDPFVGFYHQTHFSRESLACDLIEPLRVDVDRFAMGLFERKELLPSQFSSHPDGACLMSKTARTVFYPAYEVFVEAIRQKVRSRTDAFSRTVASQMASTLDDLSDESCPEEPEE